MIYPKIYEACRFFLCAHYSCLQYVLYFYCNCCLGNMKIANAEVMAMSPDQAAPTSPLAKFSEPPGSATLRFRKQPFLRIDYSIQVNDYFENNN